MKERDRQFRLGRTWGAGFLLLLLGAPGVSVAQGMDKAALLGQDGRKLFEENQCTKCHTVRELGLARTPAFYAELKKRLDIEPKDLSGVGLEHEEDYLRKWIVRKIEKEGKTHKGEYEGTEEDLGVIVKWLSQLKFPKKAK